MEFKGSKTEENLKKAFSGESEARNRYTIFAEAAKKAGYVHISDIFLETAENEREHGKIWLQILLGDKIHSTIDNLIASSETEHYEWSDMYAKFAQDAKEEGFDHIAFLFDKIRGIEEMHETRYRKLISDIKGDLVFKQPEKVVWECAKCGYTHTAEEAPKICPFCQHPQAFFFIKCFNY